MKNEKNNIFWIFFRKIWKNVEKIENDEKGSCIAEKGQNWWKIRKIIFFGFFSGKYRKMSKNCEKWWKRVIYCWKRPKLMKNEKKIIFFWIFSGQYGEMSKKVKSDEKGSDIHEKGQMWWKMKIIIFFGFFSGKYGKMSKKVKNDEKRVRYWWKRSKLMKNENYNIFWIFFRKIWRNVEKSEKWWKKGHILMKKVKIDEKWKK